MPRRHITLRAAYVALAGLALAAACGDAPPDKQLAELRSWTATIRLTAADLRRGAITARFADQLRHQATKSLAGASIEKGEGAPPGTDRAEALAAADSLRRAIHALDQGLAR